MNFSIKLVMGKVVLITLVCLLFLLSYNVIDVYTEPLPSRIGSLPSTAALIFASNADTGSDRRELYAMDADGGNVVRLTFTSEHHFISGMDRSRRYIVTTRVENDTDSRAGLSDEDRKALWLIDLGTKAETRLTGPNDHAEGRSFSPDGEWIVFCMKLSSQGEGQADIYKIKRDGTGLTRLTNSMAALECDASWSPVGNEIAFTYIDANLQRSVLKKMDTNGGNIQTIYDGDGGIATAFSPGNYDPSWSPDGQWIVFGRAVSSTGNWNNGIWHIFKVRRDGSEVVDLSVAGNHADTAEYLPSFSPDGKKIVFGSMYEAGNPELCRVDILTMDANGGSLNPLTNGPGNNMYPAWITPANPINVGIFRNGYWALDTNGNGQWGSGTDALYLFAQSVLAPQDISGAIPVTGDWDGSGKTKVGLYVKGVWLLDMNGNGQWDSGDVVYGFGAPGYIPVTGDWNGDGKTKIGVFRDGWWALDMNGNGQWDSDDVGYSFGAPGYIPITGDWNGDGKTKIGVFRDGWWALDMNGNGQWNQNAIYYFGGTNDKPITGRW